jgi:hypothetical protein
MSVPPEIDDRHRSALISRYTYSKPSGTSGLPVENIARSAERSWVARAQAGLGDAVDELGRGAEVGHALGLGVVEEDRAVADHRRAVVEQQRRPGRQARHQPVPHHPAAGGEVEQLVAGLHVAVQAVLLDVLQQHAAGAMDDALGHPVVPDEYMM